MRKTCPYCGHKDVYEVVCYHATEQELNPTPLDDFLKGRAPVFVFTFCDKCWPLPHSRLAFDCGKSGHELHKEFQYYLKGVEFSGTRHELDSVRRPFVDLFWKCKRCLRTWSPVMRNYDVPECPRCHMKSGVRIFYGLPGYEAGRGEERGEIVLGGCIVWEGQPEWHCRECGYKWGSIPQD